MDNMKTFQGSRHCQSVKFEVDADLSELTICDCSICIRKNALMVKVHEDSIRILSSTATLTTYNSTGRGRMM